MGHQLNRFYRAFGEPHFFQVVSQLGFELQWAVEAGCHDGKDTRRLIEEFGMSKVFAFEPDEVARSRAAIELSSYLNSVVDLSSAGLSDVTQKGYLRPSAELGDGSSQVSVEAGNELNVTTIDLVRLDDINVSSSSNGLYWLDVEGHALEALIGSANTLRAIDVAKIEVQMHQMGAYRRADALAVIRSCRRAGLIPLWMPIHPGYFGDIYFFRKSKLSNYQVFKSFLKFGIFFFLHRFVYPVLGKPKTNT